MFLAFTREISPRSTKLNAKFSLLPGDRVSRAIWNLKRGRRFREAAAAKKSWLLHKSRQQQQQKYYGSADVCQVLLLKCFVIMVALNLYAQTLPRWITFSWTPSSSCCLIVIRHRISYSREKRTTALEEEEEIVDFPAIISHSLQFETYIAL